MSATSSTMVPLSSLAPDFTLPDTVSGKTLSLNQIKGQAATVVMFICNHCPYVKHVNNELLKLTGEYLKKGIGFIAISSNDAENYPEDGPVQMAQVAADLKYPFPYLYDESQQVARAYNAACTP